MAGLCEGGNEPPGSLKANNMSFRDIERIPNLSAEQSDDITVFRISTMTSLTDAPPVSHRFHQLAEVVAVSINRQQ
ncbi:hypothetical protein ANN_06379 [Periplaneta americana]|uniref:Uncharacterized protein n=1 Tax=Periplaneta americana TaxID=6978 RepID=A0ABQ8TDD4_PERAM|nr:hypothetical protein ANN_06379 [Periplaneta americana]